MKDMFWLKDLIHTILLTGGSGNTAVLICGVTIYLVAKISVAL
jgi:hypothetical protein